MRRFTISWREFASSLISRAKAFSCSLALSRQRVDAQSGDGRESTIALCRVNQLDFADRLVQYRSQLILPDGIQPNPVEDAMTRVCLKYL